MMFKKIFYRIKKLYLIIAIILLALGIFWATQFISNRSLEMPKTIKEAKLTDFERYNDLGAFYINHQKYDDALKALNEALKIKPDYGPAIENIGLVYLKKGDYAKALDYFQRAERIIPDAPTLLNSIGVLYRETKKFDRAIEYFDRALKINPKFYDALYNKALTYEDMGKVSEALNTWRYYIQIASESPQEQIYIEEAKKRLNKGGIRYEKR